MARSKQKQERLEPKEKKLSAGLIPGILLTGLGILFLLSDLNILTLDWTLVPLILGIIFLIIYIFSRVWAFLIPGVILSGVGAILLFNLESYGFLFVLSVALSFLIVYLTKEESTKWALIPAGILFAISIVVAFEELTNIEAFPVALIIIGAYFLYKNYKK